MNCSFASQESPCSSLGTSPIVLPLNACKQDIKAHLLGPGVSGKRGWRSQSPANTEKELILNRAGQFDLSEDRIALMTICPKHRRNLTVDWPGRKSTTFCSLRSWRNIVARGRPTRGNGGGAANSRGKAARFGISKRLLPILLTTSPPVFTLHCQNFTSHANNPASHAG